MPGIILYVCQVQNKRVSIEWVLGLGIGVVVSSLFDIMISIGSDLDIGFVDVNIIIWIG
jgi:hypothetical protein